MINPVQNITRDGRPTEGITYPEHLAPGVSLDSGLRVGMLNLEPLPLSVHKTSLVARPHVEIRTSHWKPVINPVTDITTDGLPMEGNTWSEHLALGVSLDSRLIKKFLCPDIVNHTDVNDDINTDLPESPAPMMKSPTVHEWPYFSLSVWPTLNPEIINQTDVNFDMDTDPPENSAPMIGSDLMIVDWEDAMRRGVFRGRLVGSGSSREIQDKLLPPEDAKVLRGYF